MSEREFNVEMLVEADTVQVMEWNLATKSTQDEEAAENSEISWKEREPLKAWNAQVTK